MKHRNSHLLVGYWNRLRQDLPVPDQADIDPRAIKRILSFVFILDSSDPGQPFYRLAGTSHCERYGAELKGSNYLAQWEKQSRSALIVLLRQSLATKTPVSLASIAATAQCGMAELESVLAPISFGGMGPSRFIGISQLIGDPLGLAGNPIVYERLIGSQFICEENSTVPADYAPTASRLTPTKAPHLRLVVNRQSPAAHFETMENLIAALGIVRLGPLNRIR